MGIFRSVFSQARRIDDGNGIRVAVGDDQRLLVRTQRQAGGRQAHGDFAHRLCFASTTLTVPEVDEPVTRIGHHLRSAAGRDRIAGAGRRPPRFET